MRSVYGFLFFLCLIDAPIRAEVHVPADLIRLPPDLETVFVAETSTAKFHRFSHRGDGVVEYRGNTYMSIGQNGIGKQRNGDRKTPLGIYFVTEQLDTSRMHEKYGATAFTLDYPSALDRRQQRTGDGIWIHGVDPRGGDRPPLDTDGCIALPNESLAALQGDFRPNATPVLVSRELRWAPQRQVDTLRRDLDAAVSDWAHSQASGDLHAYLALYDEAFQHWGMSRKEWVAFKSETLGSRPAPEISIGALLLLADPAEARTYLSRFRMVTTGESRRVVLTKRLYWRRNAQGLLKIIAEDSG